MARSLKTRGLEELGALKKRVNRQHLLGRIARSDRDALNALMDQIESHIIRMPEKEDKKVGNIW